MTNRPVIAVAWPKADYLKSLERAGATPRVLQPAHDRLPDALGECDGVLLTGGADVDPRLYGDDDRHPSVEVDRQRDEYEVVLTRHALERDLPLLAICRGIQVLNVVAGGTLVQDIPTALPESLLHRNTKRPPGKKSHAHDVHVAPGTRLSTLLDASDQERIAVNSRHHQSVKAVAPGFTISATAPDGIIEAVEKPSARFCIGVQWHPENYWRTGEFSRLFEGFVQAAQSARTKRLVPR